MKKICLAVLAMLPLAAVAAPARIPLYAAPSPCPDVAARYQPATQTVTLNQPGKEPLKVEVPMFNNSAALPPLYHRLMALELHTAPEAASMPPEAGMFQAMQPMHMPDNTFRSAYMRCDLSELWVVSRGGLTDTTRWYGPYKLAEIMSARGDAAPRFQ